MSRRSDENLKGVPMKPYDMVREGLIVLSGVTVVVVLLAIFWGVPDYPTVTIKEVATKQPVPFLQLVASYLSGESDFQTYGPPYTNNPENAQKFGFISPQKWVGEITPINAQQDFVLKPLQKLAVMEPQLATAMSTYDAASDSQRSAWTKSYVSALDKAQVSGNSVVVPAGDYGPVETMLNAMLVAGRAGILEGVLDSSNAQLPYDLVNNNSILFLQGDILDKIAGHLDQQGGQWGMAHEMGPYPGAWWMWPYAFLYQIQPLADSPNADLIAGLIMALVFFLLFFLPVIPGLNRIPHAIGIYRLIWRDWYRRVDSADAKGSPEKEEAGS